MNEKNAWDKFVNTGYVSDYLVYRQIKKTQLGDINETQCQRNCAEGQSLWRKQ